MCLKYIIYIFVFCFICKSFSWCCTIELAKYSIEYKTKYQWGVCCRIYSLMTSSQTDLPSVVVNFLKEVFTFQNSQIRGRKIIIMCIDHTTILGVLLFMLDFLFKLCKTCTSWTSNFMILCTWFAFILPSSSRKGSNGDTFSASLLFGNFLKDQFIKHWVELQKMQIQYHINTALLCSNWRRMILLVITGNKSHQLLLCSLMGLLFSLTKVGWEMSF